MNTTPALAPDTAIALGIASTAMPFARTPQACAERWLRILRLYGESGVVLQGLGVSEEPVQLPGESKHVGQGAPSDVEEPDVIAQIIDAACYLAGKRGAPGITTTDLLLAVMRVHGEDFDRALQAHGTNSEEVSERLGGEAGDGTGQSS